MYNKLKLGPGLGAAHALGNLENQGSFGIFPQQQSISTQNGPLNKSCHDAIGNGQVKLQLWSWIIAAQVLIQDKFWTNILLLQILIRIRRIEEGGQAVRSAFILITSICIFVIIIILSWTKLYNLVVGRFYKQSSFGTFSTSIHMFVFEKVSDWH